MPRLKRGEQGFALAAIIVALASISLMITGVFLLALSEQRLGAASVALLQAQLAAEAGLNSVEPTVGEPESAGTPRAVGRTSGAVGRSGFEAYRLVLGRHFSIVEAVGYGPKRRARRTVATVWENVVPDLEVNAAVTVGEGVAPPEWTDISLLGEDGALQACSFDRTPESSPTFRVNPEGVPPRGPDFDYLENRAAVRLTGGTVALIGPSYLPDGTCDTTDAANWGDPAPSGGDCDRYFPFIHSAGDLKIIGGVGQGILFVEGDLELAGGFEFEGLLIVGGRLEWAESGARINGAVVAGTVDFGSLASENLSSMAYSPCAIAEALESHLIPRALPQRGWVGPS